MWQQWFAWFLTIFKILCFTYICPDTKERTVVVTYIQRLLSHQVLDIAKLRPYQGASNNTTTGSSSNLHQHYEIWLIVGCFSIANRVGWTKCFLILRLLEHVFNSGQNGCWKIKGRPPITVLQCKTMDKQTRAYTMVTLHERNGVSHYRQIDQELVYANDKATLNSKIIRVLRVKDSFRPNC